MADRAVLKSEFEANGFVVVPNLFSALEVDQLRNHFMDLRKSGQPGDFAGVDLTSTDPLKKYPRMIHMHRWDRPSMEWAIDARINQWLTEFLGTEPYMVQTMLYFKPAGARGQALHQDNSYLRAQPGNCCAAWLALDDCDLENGCMQLVPGTHQLPLLCTVEADTTQSFTDVTVPLPEGKQPVPVLMKAGDVLFFNGSVIHGSFPNTSKSRFRRALIGHYLTGESTKVAEFYHPVYRMDGSIVDLEISADGGKCGVWVETNGEPTVEMVDRS